MAPESKHLRCPKCAGKMTAVVFAGVEVDRCEDCGGIWFDAREMEQLRGTRGAEAIDTGDPAVGKKYNRVERARCPRCGVAMVRMIDRKQHHLWYEACGTCGGTFLDAGEFRDLRTVSLLDLVRDLFAGRRS